MGRTHPKELQMATRKSDKQSPETDEDDVETSDNLAGTGNDALARRATDEGDGGGDAEDATDPLQDELDEAGLPSAEDVAAAQLGTERYVLAGFFAFGMLAAYVFGRFMHGVWAYASNKDWLSQTLPRIAAVAEDDKTTISFVVGGLSALILVVRTYRKPEVRSWSDEVASELAKVKWPSKKDVTNSTMIVIAASFIATVYLALLDRLWGFITNLVYGDGS